MNDHGPCCRAIETVSPIRHYLRCRVPGSAHPPRHTVSQILKPVVWPRAANMRGADELMLRIYAAMAQKERELIGERTRVALEAGKARWRALGGATVAISAWLRPTPPQLRW